MIDSEEVTFLCRKETVKDWRTTLEFTKDKLEFNDTKKSVDLMVSEGGHMLARLELVGKWNDDDAVFLVKKEENIADFKSVKRIHKILNHKKKEQLYYTYRNTGKGMENIKKVIDDVVDKCKICQKSSKSKSKYLVAISRVSDFNLVVAVDLKMMV